ncbi:hypothetical protein RHA1_ro10329 (plasmid) [Rhodococcus jostii RHA1]|uniref:Uncharacterized protein n=1 Tax=Rhodococcus jostii (strain RHA1) TaxID=101510 RepID=Q0RW18_RHOJR|nr:hypothetical protein RHA1_ro10329 [Rhodococcus jostii RHA1]
MVTDIDKAVRRSFDLAQKISCATRPRSAAADVTTLAFGRWAARGTSQLYRAARSCLWRCGRRLSSTTRPAYGIPDSAAGARS